MHPAPSIILFTVASGLGFGLLAMLGLGLREPTGLAAFLWFGLGYALALAGLAASAFHLGHPERALKAFSQWRTSWLSREAVLAAVALIALAPHAAGLVFLGRPVPLSGYLGSFLALQTVLATAMIYAQLRTVPRWNHWSTPSLFLAAALAGGAILIGAPLFAQLMLALLGAALLTHWLRGDRRLGESGSSPETATGLGAIGRVRLLEPPHSAPNYVMREMVHVVARRHVPKLRALALIGAVIAPALILWAAPGQIVATATAALLHALGMLAARWLFFAEAEHVVGFYYGRR